MNLSSIFIVREREKAKVKGKQLAGVGRGLLVLDGVYIRAWHGVGV